MLNISLNCKLSSRNHVHIWWTLAVACLLLTTSNSSKPRPWCLDGSVLCRGRTAPTERFGHTITLLPANKMETRQVQAVTIGGQRSLYATSLLPLSMLEIINLEDMTLRSQEAAFALPANVSLRTRSGHAAVPYRDTQLLVFGGLTYNRAEALTAVTTNDVLLLDWGSVRNGEAMPTWQSLYNRTGGGGSDPLPRHRAAAAVAGELLWVFGGLDNFTHILSDTFRFNITRGRWRTMITNITGSVVPCDSNGVPGLQRAAMAASPSGRFVLLYGGRNESDFPQKGLWLLDTASMGPNNTIKWIKLGLEFPGGADLDLRGYDSTMTFIRTENGGQELLIASMGAWKTSPMARPTSWRQWVNVIKSETAGGLEALLEHIVAAGSTASAARLPFVRRQLFINSVPGSPILLPDNTHLSSPDVERVPYPSHLLWVRDAALALTADGKQLFVSGGVDTTKAATKFLILNLERGTVIDADSSLRPDYVQSSLSGFLFRHAIHVTVPSNLTAWRPDDTRAMTDLMLYTGLDNVNADGDPKFTEIQVLDTANHRIAGSCSATNVKASTGSCTVLPLPRPGTSVTDLPSPRDGAALAPLHQVFHWRNATYSTDIGTVILLMYGGMSLVGDVFDTTGSPDGGPWALVQRWREGRGARDSLSSF
ncbi:hypothetical protein Vafri_18055 [Volvox africanus]|uniref:Uncharacterized protein n=1 Tax=Volvox africanus TaxID=51714 RepID=A0A8J4F7B9_9CHLO|nr:hypothetical protein Vafri_18055 [Volvox africanus]